MFGVQNLSIDRIRLPGVVLVAAAMLLALEPMRWLIKTWFDPSYDSNGFVVFAVCVVLFAWSVSSKQNVPNAHRRLAYGLLVLSALVRLAGQVLAVNTIGALTLVTDVFAIGLMLGLQQRARAISPAWLAIAFAFSLPLERIVQRTIGYGLQYVSADGACRVLQSTFDNVVCSGVRIVLNGRDVLVDLPCSGAQATLLLLLAFSVVACLARPSFMQAIVGSSIALVAALVSNVLRICILAIGIAHPDWLSGINVMEQPWHDMVGLLTLALACMPLILWMRCVVSGAIQPIVVPTRVQRDGWWLVPLRRYTHWPLTGSISMFLLAILIVNMPRTPIDVARAEKPLSVPVWLAGHASKPLPLTKQEQKFFTQFGGTAAKARYGDHSLLLVRTSSPLRHLHAPEDCLRGLGFRVTYLGAEFSPVPTAVYRAVAASGESYRIDVSFVSEHGRMTTNVATAVWHWIQGTDRVWTAVQRITPEQIPAEEHLRWGRAVLAALELDDFEPIHKAHGVRR